MRRRTIQEDIAELMDGLGTLSGQNATMARIPMDQPSSIHVIDDVGDEKHTEMRQCSAQGCSNNINGSSCGLTAIEISSEGGCSSYEARADGRWEEEDEPDEDQETIIGISSLMPSEVDYPSQVGINSRFNTGTMM